jgi:hypothetical protein
MKNTAKFLFSCLLAASLLFGIMASPVAAECPNIGDEYQLIVTGEQYQLIPNEDGFTIEYVGPVISVVPHPGTLPSSIEVEVFETSVDWPVQLVDQYYNLLWEFHEVINWTYTDTGLIYSVDSYYCYPANLATGWSYLGLDSSSTTYGSSSFTYVSRGHFYSSSVGDLYPHISLTAKGDGTYVRNSSGID